MEKTQEFRPLQTPTETNILHAEVEMKGMSLEIESSEKCNGDEDQLARLGKKQVLKVHDHRLRTMQ